MTEPSSSTSPDVPLQLLGSGTQDGDDSNPPSTPGLAKHTRPPPSSPHKSPQSPLSHLKARLSLFGTGTDDHEHHTDDAGSGSGDSEYELLLDPNLPTDYSQRHQALPRHSLSTLDPEHPHEDDDDVHDKPRSTSLDSDHAPLVVQGGDDEEEEVEDSPYPEVRAAVAPFDDPSLPCNTLRAWTIGLSLIFLGASMNTLFSLRSPNISLGALIAQVIAWPLGRGWARFVPDKEIAVPVPLPWLLSLKRKRVIKVKLNPGPFNIKEHAIIVVMASVSFSVAYATDIILAQKVFYKQDFGVVWQLLLVVSTQSLGYGIAGMMRRFLVYPASMIWPGNLVSVTLMNAMYESSEDRDPTVIGGSMPRYRWFALVTLGAFVYYFIPGFLAQFLSSFAFMTWLAPNNPVVNQLFGYTTGLSLLPITFDWTQISGFVGSPLIPPWHAIANTMIGVVLFFVFLASVLHYSGTWYSQYLPMSDSNTYDNTGKEYDVSRILTADYTLDVEAYNNYSPLFLSTTFAISYGLSFAAITSLVVYTYLHHGKTIWRQYKSSTTEKPDIHMKLMRRYKEAPTWWYMSLFAVMLVIGFITVLAWPTNLTWWAFLLAVFISFAFSLPIGIIQAVTNNQIGLNVLTEFVYGYIQPGRPLALMIFKTFGYITMSQALTFVSDLKFGHYMKIPPRTMFMAQVVATTFSCFVQVIVLNYALRTIPGICEPTQPEHFTCPGGKVFFSASVIWGLIGPARIFSPGQIYSSLFIFFLLGAITPVVIYLAARRRPKSFLRYLMAPVIFGGAGAIPPATPLNYLSWGIVGFVFQYLIKKRHFAWWRRLNFLTSSGLDLGLALSTLVIFFAFTLREVAPPQWWGNEVVKTTLDYKGEAVQVVLPPGETFGPASW
ncbi:OPT oligopeptide transporter protein-domain-containing protein [Achaetomium macrosporum]|uniref:OPT oligopeptide transporter protein-domain-containing protein n=1 Tax=Achaetomium macrosporum TaxID=79813 RepID=A0AAN7CA15_9PEZI|nr:OPT oligopeptide transporter protein-domain-containing protein [Achaetomium macrosporum]